VEEEGSLIITGMKKRKGTECIDTVVKQKKFSSGRQEKRGKTQTAVAIPSIWGFASAEIIRSLCFAARPLWRGEKRNQT